MNDASDIFAGTGELVGETGGVFRSSDNGETWIQVNSGLPTEAAVAGLAINELGHLFAAVAGFGAIDTGGINR